MIRYRRTTRTAIILEGLGEMHELETDTDIMMVLPRWVCKAIRSALRLGFIIKLEIKVWRSNTSLLNKIAYGYQMAQ
jgi:hypothetical protein